ncbi:hypothetical protein DPV78_007515 [Talaromyces pinophilus]|nr:hypothetical protein DPV78_007515 [Talaromyces pinophilus]
MTYLSNAARTVFGKESRLFSQVTPVQTISGTGFIPVVQCYLVFFFDCEQNRISRRFSLG